MTDATRPLHSWREAFQSILHPRVISMLFLGFSAGIPILLIFSSLSLWLSEAGIKRSTVTFFSWAALSYSFKFLWSPLIDKIPVPWLTRKMGKRRSWILVTQLMICASIALMATIDPSVPGNLGIMAFATILLGFSAASQDIVIDAYRIESASKELQTMMASSYITGYRLGTVVAGAGALYLASWLGSEKHHYLYIAWRWTYFSMIFFMLIGIVTTLLIPEPEHTKSHEQPHTYQDYLRILFVFIVTAGTFITAYIQLLPYFADSINLKPFISTIALISGISADLLFRYFPIFIHFLLEVIHFLLSIFIAIFMGWLLIRLGAINRSMAREVWIDPVKDFFQRYGVKSALILLVLIGLYRITDIVPGVISNVFYQDLGFSKNEIATAVKTIGVFISIVGGFLGGIFAMHYGVMRSLMLGAILTAFTNLVFVWLAFAGHDIVVMYIAVTADNLAAGFASAAFIAFLSSLTNISFTAVQYAIFSSLMTLLPKTIGGYSGTIVDNIDYSGFFIFTTLIGIPVIWLVWVARNHLSVK